MANNNNLGKKGGPQAGLAKASETAETVAAPKKDNVFSRHGNQQISEAIQQTQAQQQTQQQSLLASLEAETEQGPEKAPAWAAETAKTEEEESSIARRPEAEAETKAASETAKKPANATAAAMLTESAAPEKKVADEEVKGIAQKNSDAEALVAAADEKQLDEVKAARQASPGLLSEEAVMLAMAEAKGLDEEKKAEMLLAKGNDVDLELLEGESGELRTLVVAEQLPPELAAFAKDAATEASDSPLSERDTMKNLMDQILTISQQIGNHSQLTDPTASVEEKATRLVELVAYELDIPTRESVSSHPFHALLEDMIFDPAGVMQINRVAGNRRDVRTIGSFAVVLWQLAYDAMQMRLDNLDDKQQINETDFLASVYNEMARDMFTEAMSKPSSV